MIKKEKEKVGNTLNIGELMTNIKSNIEGENMELNNREDIENMMNIFGEEFTKNFALNIMLDEILKSEDFKQKFKERLIKEIKDLK